AKSLGGGTCAFAAGEPPAEAAVGARRNDHRTPKKSCGVAGPPSFERRRVLMDAVAALAPGSGSSRPREFHPQSLTEPDLTLSCHPALQVSVSCLDPPSVSTCCLT